MFRMFKARTALVTLALRINLQSMPMSGAQVATLKGPWTLIRNLVPFFFKTKSMEFEFFNCSNSFRFFP